MQEEIYIVLLVGLQESKEEASKEQVRRQTEDEIQ
jgi:hypothetical protein